MEPKKKTKSITRFSYAIGKIILANDELVHGDEYKSHYTLYDEIGNQIEILKYNNDGELEERHTSVYDAKGNVIEEATYYALDDISEKVTITRNDGGLIIQEETTFGDGSMDKTIYNRFDDRNLL